MNTNKKIGIGFGILVLLIAGLNVWNTYGSKPTMEEMKAEAVSNAATACAAHGSTSEECQYFTNKMIQQYAK